MTFSYLLGVFVSLSVKQQQSHLCAGFLGLCSRRGHNRVRSTEAMLVPGQFCLTHRFFSDGLPEGHTHLERKNWRGGDGGKRKKGEREEVGEQGEAEPGEEVHLCSPSVWEVR